MFFSQSAIAVNAEADAVKSAKRFVAGDRHGSAVCFDIAREQLPVTGKLGERNAVFAGPDENHQFAFDEPSGVPGERPVWMIGQTVSDSNIVRETVVDAPAIPGKERLAGEGIVDLEGAVPREGPARAIA